MSFGSTDLSRKRFALYCMVVDHESVNKATVNNMCSIPHIDAVTNATRETAPFVTMDYTFSNCKLPFYPDSRFLHELKTPDCVTKTTNAIWGGCYSAENSQSYVESCLGALRD